jgi:SMODS and SLOG-associating 2TM effector domain
MLGFDDHDDPHKQFCMLAGVPASDVINKHYHVAPKSLYGRATKQYTNARRSHAFMASLSNTLLLSQVILGAALTALGASESSHILITLFGATNTVIAGLVAYLKSRGQPMRSRMYRDDLERVVDEIENSEIMWLGIAENIHGYDEIDVGDKVTVRSEVARLMRLYERAIRSNMMNNPDNYLLGGGNDGPGTALRSRPAGTATTIPVTLPQIVNEIPGAVQPASAPAIAADPDESPATAPPKPPQTTEPAKDPVPKSSEDSAGVAKPKEGDPEEPAKADPLAVNDSKSTLAPDVDASPASTDPPKLSDSTDGEDKPKDATERDGKAIETK